VTRAGGTLLSELRALPLLAALLATCAVAASPARANGDPASDYLITLPVFLPFESKVSDAAQNELTELLAAAKAKGFEVRVALIGTRRDLGAVPVLYGKPQRYADFLGQELVYYYKGVLLVVMPNGYGIYKNGAALPAEKAVLAKLPPPGSTDGNALAASASDAVHALARERGIALTVEPGATKSSSNRDRVQIVAGVILLCGVALAARLLLSRRRKGDPGPA
jgi:hypothetical protein